MTKFVSLCLLSYKRPERLRECIASLLANTDFPYELIVNSDGGDDISNREWLTNQESISKLILVNGKNRGVGRSFANCVGMAEGDYIFKIDTDLTFKPHWLSTAIRILNNNEDVGAVSLFDYNHYDPNDTRFTPENNIIEERNDCLIVKDFVSSIYGFRKNCLDIPGWDQDDGYHQKLYPLAITKQDYVVNHGFGVTKSTYVLGTEDKPFKTPTHDKPLIVGV